MQVEDIFAYDKKETRLAICSARPIAITRGSMRSTGAWETSPWAARSDWCVAPIGDRLKNLRMEPKHTWKLFYEDMKFRSTAGFITGANPLHRGHEYIHKNALEEIDGLFLQPLVEMAKREYTRHEFRVFAYKSVLDTYYPKDRAILAPLRVTYIFAGPREAVLHAIIMKNYGCTHALIGRDHAGIGDYMINMQAIRYSMSFVQRNWG